MRHEGEQLKSMTMMQVNNDYEKGLVNRRAKVDGAPRLKVVATRLTAEQIKTLDKVVNDCSARIGFRFSRAAIIAHLIEKAAEELG